jgi:hypothetical protein
VELDHVLVAVPDLEAGAKAFEDRYGLTSVEGGRHSGWGTANRIVPLGHTYIELVAVVDPEEAASSDFGSWVASADPLPRPIGWAVRCLDLEARAEELGVGVTENSRPTAGGEILSWKVAGIKRAELQPSHPILIQWGEGAPFPGAVPVEHPAGRVNISRLHLSGDRRSIVDWLGTEELPLDVSPGLPAVLGVDLTGPEGEHVEIRAR